MVLGEKLPVMNEKLWDNNVIGTNKADAECISCSVAQSPPDGGFIAWLQVAGAFCLFLNTWGVANMYGVFQTYYESNILNTRSASAISWIGSVQGALLFFGSAVSGPLFDMGYLRTLLSTGTLFTVGGMMTTSICKNYWQIVLAQGVTIGLGFGCIFLLCVGVVSQYFTSKKAFAFGIASTGGSIGGVIYPIIFRQLQPRIGFPWATRVIGFAMLATMMVPLAGMRLRSLSRAKRHDILVPRVFTNKPYLVFIVGTFFGFMSLYVTFFYIQLYAQEQADVADGLSSYLLSIINASSILGRLIPSFLADKIGALNIHVILAFATAIVCFGWAGIKDSAGIISFCVLYGLLSGSYGSLPGVIVVSLSEDISTLGVQLGISFIVAGCGLLIGGPIAGAILRGHGGWIGLQAWCGTLLAISGIFSLATRILKVGTEWNAKV